MSKELILKMSMSVDGFVAAPNGDLDWIFRSRSETSTQWLVDLFATVGLHAIGHGSYDMADYWPTSTHPLARAMNEIPKAVFSRSGQISPPSMEKTLAALNEAAPSDKADIRAAMDSWMHPIVAGQDLVADIQRLKAEDGKPILAHGGASFASSLIAANLVDVFHLTVHPIALGRGLPIFAKVEKPLDLKLEGLTQFDSGVVIKTYRPS